MKTPYDPALRIRQREIDQMQVSINVEVTRLTELETTRLTIDDTIRRESSLAAQDWAFSAHHYLARMQSERRRVREEAHHSAMRLDGLRLAAMEAYGSMRAIGAAADQFRDEAARQAASAEQAQIDDLSGGRRNRRPRVGRHESF